MSGADSVPTTLGVGVKWKTFRFLVLNRAGRIGWEHRSKLLYLTLNKAKKQLHNRIIASLKEKEFKKAA